MKINTMVKAFLAVTIVANCTLTAQSKVIEGKVETQEILPTINFANLTAQLDKSGLSFKENCAPFDPDKIQLVKQNSRWIILKDFKDSSNWLLDFGDKQEAAAQALDTIRKYGFNKLCRCGKAGASGMQYFLVDDKAPEGYPESLSTPEDSLLVDQSTVQARYTGGAWKVVQGPALDEWMLDFRIDEQTAKQSAEIIKHYGFKRQVFIGRPGAPMQFFRK